MRPDLLRSVFALAAIGVGDSDTLVATPSGLERRRSRPEPWRSPAPFPPEPATSWRPHRQSSPIEDIERVRLADEKRARKGARLDAAAAKGAIRRAGT